MRALILVDLQNDFMPGGALAIPDGHRVIPLINEIIYYPFDLVIASKDWHPADHSSFADTHGKQPGEHMQLAGLEQILWPTHCVQGTQGAEFAPGWNLLEIDKIIYKGTDPLIDSYSIFFDNGHRKSTGLEDYLKEKGIKDLFIAGLATDYCVKYSVLDALQLGFRPYVILEACRGINLKPEDTQHALQIMRNEGALLLSIADLKDQLKNDRQQIF
jgi:nicotinamidase/pyrazinamidase